MSVHPSRTKLFMLLSKLGIKSARRMPVDMGFQSILKELYQDDVLKDLVYIDNPFLKLIPKEKR